MDTVLIAIKKCIKTIPSVRSGHVIDKIKYKKKMYYVDGQLRDSCISFVFLHNFLYIRHKVYLNRPIML